MLIVLASIYDNAARDLISRWNAHDAYLLTCKDLSKSGWEHYLNSTDTSTAVIGGKKINVKEIDGVLTLLPYVTEMELSHIFYEDREYVAMEMMAFLVSWLSNLKCPILNRPKPTCLTGPNWSQEEWNYTAAQAGIPVHTINRHASIIDGISEDGNDIPSTIVTVVGNNCFGDLADEEVVKQSLSLAHIAGTDLLSIKFSIIESSYFFIGAQCYPPTISGDIENAILEHLLGSGR